MKLSPELSETLAAIKSFVSASGYPPTGYELAEKLGITQTTARQRILALERHGALKTTPKIARSIVLL